MSSVSGFIVVLGHCKAFIIVAAVLRRKVHFKFFFILFSMFHFGAVSEVECLVKEGGVNYKIVCG